MPSRRLLVIGLAAVAVLAGGAVLYKVKKTRDLESSAASSAARATEQLREAAGLGVAGPKAAETLRAHGEELERRLAALRAEDASRNRALAEAAELYLMDAQAILRNQAAAARALAAAGASRRALEAHLAHAAGRGPGWIQKALALKSRAERDNFDARNAAETLEQLVKAHPESQAKLRAAVPGMPLLGEAERGRLRDAARGAVQRAADDLQKLRRLPIG